jgi:hypothetical protein
MKTTALRLVSAAALIVTLFACGGGGGGSDNPTPIINTAPIASAGADQSVLATAVVTLDGSASSDANSDPLTYAWTLNTKPVGSAATLTSPTSAKSTFTADVVGIYAASLIVNDGKVNSSAATVTITTSHPAVLSQAIDRTATAWYISSSTSAIDGKKTTSMFVGGASGANFHIYCSSDGTKGYYISTEYVTGSGFIRYRVGNNPVVTQAWNEAPSVGYRQLIPAAFDITLLQKMYQNWDFEAEIDRYGIGIVSAGFSRINGFAAAIEKTRADCGWSTTTFPPNNGWLAEYPDVPPADAIEATYSPSATQQFGLIAWRATNPTGSKQILVRLGVNKNLCKGSFVIDDSRLYVLQNGRLVSAVSGTKFSLSCETDLPATFALQGDFDASQPLELKAYPFHFNTLNPGEPISSVSFN